jgi:uncharacterized protein YacL
MDARRDERSLGELFGDLSRQLSTLVRQEIDLARTEVTTAAGAAARDAALGGVGVVLLHGALLAALATVTLVLVELGLDAWLAALIVTIVAGAVGAMLAMRARDSLSTRRLTPDRTVETLKDGAEWAKERIS